MKRALIPVVAFALKLDELWTQNEILSLMMSCLPRQRPQIGFHLRHRCSVDLINHQRLSSLVLDAQWLSVLGVWKCSTRNLSPGTSRVVTDEQFPVPCASAHSFLKLLHVHYLNFITNFAFPRRIWEIFPRVSKANMGDRNSAAQVKDE